MGLVGFPGSLGSAGYLGRYLTGLCVATLGLCAAGWLALAPVAFGYRSAGRTGARPPSGALPSGALPSGALQSAALQSEALHRATLTDWATAAGLAAVSLITLAAWVVAWRRRLRADGILARTSWRQARREARAQRQRERDGAAPAGPTDPAQVLNELRALLVPLLAEPANGQAAPEPPVSGQARVQVTRGREPGDEPEEPGEPVSWHPGQDHDGPGMPVIPAARSGGLASMESMESMLSGAELLMVSCGEEEAW